MRCLAISLLGLAIVAPASAQDYRHQPKAGGTFFGHQPPAQNRPQTFGAPSTASPYQPPAPYPPHTMPMAPASPGSTDGGTGFKAFQGSSVYSAPPTRYGAKPTRPKSLYDR